MSFWSVHSSICWKVLSFEPVMSALQVPENDSPVRVRAAQAPCQPKRVLFAAQVPSKAVWPVSLNSSQEPSAEFGLSGETCAVHVPQKVLFNPAVAVQLPWTSARACWAEGKTLRPNDRIKVKEARTLPRAANGPFLKEIDLPLARREWRKPRACLADSLSLFLAADVDRNGSFRVLKAGYLGPFRLQIAPNCARNAQNLQQSRKLSPLCSSTP